MNPSKKVTELLSQFLEFDPEQLQLGIWSGNLSLNNVNLRQEAIYPLLNRHLKKNVSTATSESDNGYPEQKCLKPPLKFKLVSGKIGSLTMKIPWKRLVWGQGDVQVDLRNIVIVLALESHEDIEYRAPNTENRETRRSDYAEENDSDSCKQRNQDYTSRSNFPFSRVKKQQVLQEAEKRQLRGRPIGPWLTAITKKEEESRAKKRTAIGDTTTLELRAGRLEKWLRSTTSDFFWRFYVGLQMNVENVKIVLVQDDIELGIIMPSSKVLAGKPVNRRESGNGSIPLSCNEFELEQESNGENTSAVTPPQRAVSDEVCDVGGFIDKQLRQLGIGVYVRKLNQVDKSLSSEFVPLDVYTSDYILRPVDVDLNFSLFFPLPPEKAKQNLKGRTSIGNRQVGVVVDEMSTEGGGSDASSKRRRGKRDKLPPQSKDILTASTEPIKSIVSASQMGRLSSGSNPSVPANFGTFPPQLVRRLSSRGSKMPLLQQEHRRRHSMISDSVHPLGLLTSASRHPRQVSTAATLPLAQPDDFGAVYASNGRGEVSGRTVRFDGKLSVGAVQVICSTRHYYVISAFLAASAKMRNGRPRQTIRSVLDRENDIQRPFTDETDSSFQGHSTEFDCTRKECARVVRSWWQYIFGVIFWELRQRKRLRKIFQQKYLLFSWQQLSYKRCEYINLYIGCRLRKSDSALEEQLLAIEDELPVEQILLYRSIARTVHVRGGTEMPNSIIELNKELKGSPEHFERDNAQNSHDSAIQTSSKDDDRDNDVQFSDNVPNFLSILEARCEVARARRNTDEGSPLPAYHHFEKRSKVFEQGAFSGDEISFGFESKTIKTNQSNKTRSSAAVTMMKAANTVETAAGMVFAFSAHVKKLELLIVEEEKVPYGQCDTNSSSSVSVHSDHSTSSIHLSDVSVLTDDERFLQEEGGLLTSAVDETEATDLVYPSTDYLLFRMPEKVLFQLVITPLSCAMAGRNGVSRCFDCRIGQVKATGVDGCHFITIGAAPLAVAPVHEILVSTEASAGLQELRPRTEAPRDALFLSLAEKNDQRFLQCDTATVRLWVDPPTIFKLASFTSPSSALFPQPLLPISPREDVRLFLQQHEIPASALNCSIRMHGCHITFPLKLDHARTGNDLSFSLDSSSRGDLVDGPVVFRCTMWELYSGSAVEDLCASMEDLQSEGEVFTPLGSLQDGRRKSVKTRQLSMLEAPKLLLTSRSLLASHWVRIS